MSSKVLEDIAMGISGLGDKYEERGKLTRNPHEAQFFLCMSATMNAITNVMLGCIIEDRKND